jgi:glycosyltransferase involved in cell wall biosynthesis
VSAQPVCSVIIPSYRSAATICACLTALLRQDFSQPYEIIVIDSSPDDTPAFVRRDFPQVQLIHLTQQTDPALARNLGAKHGRGDLLAFIDADCIAPPDWLRRLCAILERGYDGAGGAIANANGESLVSWASYVCEFREFLPRGGVRDVCNLTLGNAAYRRAAFVAVGGFPSGYFPQEDQVFHHHFCRQGFRLCLDPQIVIAHFHRADRAAFLQHQHHIGRANAQVVTWLGLPGAGLARQPRLARLTLPLLVAFRFTRTLRAYWWVEHALISRRPALLWLIWQGMWAWGRGFLEGARGPLAPLALAAE